MGVSIKIGGPLLGSLYQGSHCYGSVPGSPYFGKLPYDFGPLADPNRFPSAEASARAAALRGEPRRARPGLSGSPPLGSREGMGSYLDLQLRTCPINMCTYVYPYTFVNYVYKYMYTPYMYILRVYIYIHRHIHLFVC